MEPQVSLGTTCNCKGASLVRRITSKCWCKQYDESSKPLKSLAHVVREPYYKHPFKICPMPSKYMQEECFIRITKMAQTCRIPKEEIKGVKMQNPYAVRMTYHYGHGSYKTKGHLLFQPVNCDKKLGSLYFRTLKHIFLYNAFKEDIYEEQPELKMVTLNQLLINIHFTFMRVKSPLITV